MIVRMRADAGPANFERVRTQLEVHGRDTKVVDSSIVVTSGQNTPASNVGDLPGVAMVDQIDTPYKLVHRSVRPNGTRIQVGDIEIGGSEFVIAAGPCAVENEAQLMGAAGAVARAGARVLRGGAFKPRSSPYSFRGLEKEGLRLLARAGRVYGMAVVTEVLSPEDLPLVADFADILQVGARNMQNYSLLEAVGRAGKPVLLKRGLSATVEEWLLAAEYIALQGNLEIILCERGIRTFESATRNTLDLASAVLLRHQTHLPVFVDPSHATGRSELVEPLSKAAAATGIAGLIVEVHLDPAEALCDGRQSLTPTQFEDLMASVRLVLASDGRTLAGDGNSNRYFDQIILRLIGPQASVAGLGHEGSEGVFRDIIKGTRNEADRRVRKVARAHANP